MSQNPYKTHGALSWAELMTSDLDAAKAFYKGLFGWNITDSESPMGTYSMATTEGASDAEDETGFGMATMPEGLNLPPHWGIYITVTTLDETLAKVSELGGEVVHPPHTVPGVGTFAVIKDPQGAVFQVMQYSLEGR